MIEKILRHWCVRPVSRAPPPSDAGRSSLAENGSFLSACDAQAGHGCDEFSDRRSAPPAEPREVTYVNIDEFLATL